MKVKIKAPPKSTGGEILSMLKLTKNSQTSGYATKMSNLLNFLNATGDIRTGAEVIEKEISIGEDGAVIPYETLRENYISSLVSHYRNTNKMIRCIGEQVSYANSQMLDKRIILRRKSLEKKHGKARWYIKKYQMINQYREVKIEDMVSKEKVRLEQFVYMADEMRKHLGMFTGCKIRIDLTTGSYTFPVPADVPFYREVCNVLRLPLPNQQAAAKPRVKRMFGLPPEALQAIKTAAKFVSTDDLRPAMTCVVLEINKGKMLVVATDAHRLFKSRHFEVTGPAGSFTYLMPASALKRLPKSVKEDFMLYELEDGRVNLLEQFVSLWDARFPDWKVVVPKYETGVTFEKDNFVSCVKQVLPFCNKSTSQVNIDINGQLQFAAQDIDFSFEGGVRARYLKKDMPDTVIGFNGHFLVEAMAAFKSQEVTMLSEGGPTKAAIFTDGIDEVLVMPLMIN